MAIAIRRWVNGRWCIAFVFAWIFSSSLSCLAAPDKGYLVDVWQTAQGLPQNSILSITQTREGYLWLGTFNGLARFDGREFYVFRPGTAPGVSLAYIQSLFEDSKGRLWIGSGAEGIICYENGSFRREGPAPQSRKVVSITETKEGDLLFLTTSGLVQFNGTTWQTVTTPGVDFSSLDYDSLSTNIRGETYAAIGNQLFRYTDGGLQKRFVFTALVDAMIAEADGTVLCGLRDGRLAKVPSSGDPGYIEFPGNSWHRFYRAPNGDLWASAYQGLFRQRNNEWIQLTTADGFVSNDVLPIYYDREGNLWIGTNGGGLHRVREKVVRVHSTEDGLLSNDTTSVIQDNRNQIWISGFRCGVSILSPETNRWKPFPLPLNPGDQPNILSLRQTRDGSVWIGSHKLPHYRWNGTELERLSIPSSATVTAMFEDKAGGLWIGIEEVGIEYRKGGEMRKYDESNGLSRNFIYCIEEDLAGNIWIGTPKGLNRISRDGKITVFSQKDGLAADEVHSLCSDSEGTLWIGTVGGGLSRFKENQFTSITTDNGLPGNVIGQILEDGIDLWLGTTKGIARARKQSLHATFDGTLEFVPTTLFDQTQGISQPECAGGFQPACLKARDGTLWFCTISGVVMIDPKRVPRNEIPPGVKIERIVLEDHPTPKNFEPPRNAELIVPPGTPRFEVHYTGLSLVAPDKVRFQYKLEGFDSDWLNVGTRRFAHYTRIPPGKYTFHVMAANNDGVWNETGASLAVWVQPHYWQTLWFRVLVGVAAAGLVSGAVWMRFKNLRQLHDLRLRIAHDLHDEAGSSLASIHLLTRRASKSIHKPENVAQQLAEIEQISANTAESIRQLVWLISPAFDTLDQMLQQTERLAARLLPNVKTEFLWNVARRDRVFSLQFRSHLFLAIKEIVHNVSKHAEATHFSMALSEEQGCFILTVSDNGKGFDLNTAARGNGLNSIQLRAVQLDGTLKIESEPGRGTTLTLRVPVKT